MNREILSNINTKLSNLHTLLSEILPVDSISIHPFVYYSKYVESIYNHLDSIIEEANKNKKDLEFEIEKLKESINRLRNNLELEITDYPIFVNLNMEKEYLNNEMHKLKLEENTVKEKIEFYVNEIGKYEEFMNRTNKVELSDTIRKVEINGNVNNTSLIALEVSLENLRNLESKYKILQEEKKKLEKRRIKKYRDIKEWMSKMNIEDECINLDTDIYEIEIAYEKYKKMIKEREEKVNNLKKEICQRRELLYEEFGKDDINESCCYYEEDHTKSGNNKEINKEHCENISNIQSVLIHEEKGSSFIKDTNFENESFICNPFKRKDILEKASSYKEDLSTEYISYLQSTLKNLETEYFNKINIIYAKHKSYLDELYDLFSMHKQEFEISDAGIQQMKQIITELENKKDSYLEIVNLIDKRSKILEAMNEFEKLASDPRRLFKSSFQLNKEEKFRKTAYPNLLKIEDEILRKLGEYKKQYGVFCKDGMDYEVILRNEVESRIVNKTVFINKYDSPYKRSKPQ